MGRGNVCVFGDYEGLYYVDRDYIDCYIAKEADDNGEYEQKMQCEMNYPEDYNSFDYDDILSGIYYDDFIQEFTFMMEEKFKSFVSTGNDFGTIMENNLFEIEIEDNEWSYAVKLIQKESYYDNLEGLQKKHYQSYLNGIKNILLELFPSIGCYGGAWTHGTITREDVQTRGQKFYPLDEKFNTITGVIHYEKGLV